MEKVITVGGYTLECGVLGQDYKIEESLHVLAPCLVQAWRNAAGELHCEHGPAVTIFRQDTREIVGTEWYAHDRLHREDGGPARDIREGRLRKLAWFQNGLLDREGAPAYLQLAETDQNDTVVLTERWAKAGKFHRLDGPAVLMTDDRSRVIVNESWWIEGAPSRLGGPYSIERDERTGAVIEELWSDPQIPPPHI